MADVKKDGGSLVDPITGTLEGESLLAGQAKNKNANLVMEGQIANKMQGHIDAKLLEQKRVELQSGYDRVQVTGRNARAADEAAMARIEAENVAKNTAQPKKGLFGWGFLGL